MSLRIDRLGPLPLETAASERGPARHPDRRGDDATGASAFAGIYAGAVTPGQRHRPAAEPEPKKDDEGAHDTRALSTTAATSRVERSLARLAPEFRGPLERVIDRMEKEFGHEVTVVETARDQARQDALFAQGRTAPGQVVTWTRSSRHSTGLAADLLIDGRYDHAEAYERLARIAREEGLRTLGPADPGHVELRAGGADSRAKVVLAPNGEDTAGAAGRLAQLASVARVAQVARVAEVASVARVAQPVRGGTAAIGAAGTAAAAAIAHAARGAPGGVVDAAGARSNAGEEAAKPDALAGSATRAGVAGVAERVHMDSALGGAPSSGAGRSDADSSDAERDQSLDGTVQSDDRATRRLDAMTANSGSPAAHTDVSHQPVAAPGGVDMAHRIASLLQLQANAATRPMSQVVLRLDDADGGPELIRIGIRDRGVDATLAMRDSTAAGRIEAQIGELQQALGRHGLNSDSLRVELLGPRTLESVWLGAHAGMAATSGAPAEHRSGGYQPPSYHTPPRDQQGGDGGQRSSRRQHDSSNREMSK